MKIEFWDLESELQELDKRYAPRRQENSFYVDMPEMKKPVGSPNISGNFSNYTYHIDNTSGKLIRTKLK